MGVVGLHPIDLESVATTFVRILVEPLACADRNIWEPMLERFVSLEAFLFFYFILLL
jgi:hypothetical protein